MILQKVTHCPDQAHSSVQERTFLLHLHLPLSVTTTFY